MPCPLPLLAKFGFGAVPDIGTPLFEATEGEYVDFAETDADEVGEGCATPVGAPLLEATEGEPLPL